MRSPSSLDESDRSYLLGDSDESATGQQRNWPQQRHQTDSQSKDGDQPFEISPYVLHPHEELSPRSHAWLYLFGVSIAGFFSALSMKSDIDFSNDEFDGQKSGGTSASFILLLVVLFISIILSLVVTFSYHHRTYRDRLTDDFWAEFSVESVITIILVSIWSVVQALQYVLTRNTPGLLLNCNCWIVSWLGFGLAIYLLGELLHATPTKMKGVYYTWKKDAQDDDLNDCDSSYGHGRMFECSPTHWTMLMAFGAALAAHSSALGREDTCNDCMTSLIGFTTGLLCISFSVINLGIYRLNQMGSFDGWEELREARLLKIEGVFSLLILVLNGLNIGYGTTFFEHDWVEANVFVASWTSITISLILFERIANMLTLRPTSLPADGPKPPEEIHRRDDNSNNDMRGDRPVNGRINDVTEDLTFNQVPSETIYNSYEPDLEAGEEKNGDTDSSTSPAQDLTIEEYELLKALNAKAESYSSDTSNSSAIQHGKVIDGRDADQGPPSEFDLPDFRPISSASMGGESQSTSSSPKTEPRVADPPGTPSFGHSARNVALSANARRKRSTYLVEAMDSMSLSRDGSSELETSSTDHDSGPIVYTGPMNDDEISDIVGSIMSVHSTYSIESANTPSPMHETNILQSTNIIPYLPFNFTQSNKKKDHLSDASRLSALSEYSKESELNDESLLKRSFGSTSSQTGSYTESTVLKIASIPNPSEKDEEISEEIANPNSSEAYIQVGKAVKIATESIRDRGTLDDANRSLRDTPIPYAAGSKLIASISGIEVLDADNSHYSPFSDESNQNESPAITRMEEIHTHSRNTANISEVSTDISLQYSGKHGSDDVLTENELTEREEEIKSRRNSASSELNEILEENGLDVAYTIPPLVQAGSEPIENDLTTQIMVQSGSPIPPISSDEETTRIFPAIGSSNTNDLSHQTIISNRGIEDNKYYDRLLPNQEISATRADNDRDEDDTDARQHSLEVETSAPAIPKKEKSDFRHENQDDEGSTRSKPSSSRLQISGAYSNDEDDLNDKNDIDESRSNTVEIYNLMLSSFRSYSDRQSVVVGSESGSSPSSSSSPLSSSSSISSSWSSSGSSPGSTSSSRESEEIGYKNSSDNAFSNIVTPEISTKVDAGKESDVSSDSSYFSTDVERCGSYCDVNDYGSVMSASESGGSQEGNDGKKESPPIKIPSDFDRESLANVSPDRSIHSCDSLIKRFGSISGEDEGTLKTSIGDSAFESSTSSAVEIYHLMLESLKSCSDAQSYIEEGDEDEDRHSSSSKEYPDKGVIRRKLKRVTTKDGDTLD